MSMTTDIWPIDPLTGQFDKTEDRPAMSTHTPGPWSVSGVRTRESGQKVLQISAADDKCYALVLYSDLTPAEHLASHADARLIAAAPTMYEYIASSASSGCATAQKIMEQINGHA